MSTLWTQTREPIEVAIPTARPLAPESFEPASEIAQPEVPSVRRPLIRLDAGWLFLAAGVMLIGATVLIPAQRDLVLARWQRDRAAAIERHKHERLSQYGGYLAALEQQDESLVLSLAATQLNKSPVNRLPLLNPPDPSRSSASVFPALEPEPLQLIENPDLDTGASLLERWSTNDRIRLWLLAGGVLSVLVGLLPPARV